MTERVRTIGLLYPGEMGASVSALLRRRGTAVVTTLNGRSEATRLRSAASGVIVLDSLAHVVRVSDVVFSLVLPSAAEDVAAAYCELARLAPRDAVFVDANSVGPAKVASMARLVEQTGRAFVDGSINGLAKNLATSGTLYLSGARAADVAALFEGAMAVRVVGDEPGRASAMKMLLGGLSKGICALFAELGVLAEREGMLHEMLEATGRTYPGVAAVAERMLPTYAQHAGRRLTEMNELAETARLAGMSPCVIDAVRRTHRTFAETFAAGANELAQQDAASLIQQISESTCPSGEVKKEKEKSYGH